MVTCSPASPLGLGGGCLRRDRPRLVGLVVCDELLHLQTRHTGWREVTEQKEGGSAMNTGAHVQGPVPAHCWLQSTAAGREPTMMLSAYLKRLPLPLATETDACLGSDVVRHEAMSEQGVKDVAARGGNVGAETHSHRQQRQAGGQRGGAFWAAAPATENLVHQ